MQDYYYFLLFIALCGGGFYRAQYTSNGITDGLRGSLWNYWQPLGVLGTGRHKKILLISKWRGKTELVEKVGQLCPSTETGRFRAELWSTTGVNCTHLIKQSTTASSRKALVRPKNVTKLDPTNSRYPSLNHPKSRVEWASVLAIIT